MFLSFAGTSLQCWTHPVPLTTFIPVAITQIPIFLITTVLDVFSYLHLIGDLSDPEGLGVGLIGYFIVFPVVAITFWYFLAYTITQAVRDFRRSRSIALSTLVTLCCLLLLSVASIYTYHSFCLHPADF